MVPLHAAHHGPPSLPLSVKLPLEAPDAFSSSSASVTPAASALKLGGPLGDGLGQACRVLSPAGTQAAAVSLTAQATLKTGDHAIQWGLRPKHWQ